MDNKMQSLMDIMFQEDEYRHTKEDFEAEKAEREEKKEG